MSNLQFKINSFFKILLLYYIFIINSNAIDVSNSQTLNILSSSEIFVDYDRNNTISTVARNKFNNIISNKLSFGYSPKFDVWIKFNLSNNSNKQVFKILEYANPLVTHIELYKNGSLLNKEGLFQIQADRKSLNPTFEIVLQPKENATFYVKANSIVTTLIVQLKIHEINKFYSQELQTQLIYDLFFGAMLILAIYNIFVFVFSRDISYLLYVLYVLGVIYHQLLFTGIGYVHLIPKEYISYVIELSALATTIPIIALAFFSKVFLQVSKYPRHNVLLNYLIAIVIISVFVHIYVSNLGILRNIPSMILVLVLMELSIYLAYKRNRQAYYILAGWIFAGLSVFYMYMKNAGFITIDLPYFVEFSFLIEAIIFSVALVDKIKTLQQDKNELNSKLLIKVESDKKLLQSLVSEKTLELQKAFDEQSLLLYELNHRVKNNLQTVMSLIKLQANNITDTNLKEVLETIQNRISAMSLIHELLYQKSDISTINVSEYLHTLADNIEYTFDIDVEIEYKIKVNYFDVETTISCGLILNELLINSFKYAFKGVEEAKITISLQKENDYFILKICDNGLGYNQNDMSNIKKTSFGLSLIRTIVEDHLKGTFIIDSNQSGTHNKIIWSEKKSYV
jgi:two-component sensor histidine kinase